MALATVGEMELLDRTARDIIAARAPALPNAIH